MKTKKTIPFVLALVLGLSLVGEGALAQTQNQPSNSTQPSEGLSSAQPKDITTRAKLHTELGSMYFQNGNLIVALEELTIATSINPNYAPAYSTRGIVLYYVKEYASADKDFQKALSLDPKDPEINNNYGWFLCRTGKEKESLQYFEKAIRNPLYQTPEIAYLNAGACYIQLGDLENAEAYIRKNLMLSPENPKGLLQLAKILYAKGNYDGARERVQAVVKQVDPDADALWLYIRIERRLGNTSSEKSLSAQLRRKFPDSPEYQAMLNGDFQ